MFSWLFSKACLFSLIEIRKIIRLKSTIKICDIVAIDPNDIDKNESMIIIKHDLKKTVYLKTAIIENE